MNKNKKYSLFSVIGIEIEYMIVDKIHYDVLPVADKVLQMLEGNPQEIANEVELGEIAASNELALHVIELKTNGPKVSLKPLTNLFHQEVLRLNHLLAEKKACLMPTGAHPWYDPHKIMKLWPHGDQTIYNMFHRLFNCVGHGWSNLQSVHINLPFADDEEFSKLHNAIRLLMPLIPALTASTPFIEGKSTGLKDTRLDFYGKNQRRMPIISGLIIPEFITSHADYNEKILNPIYRAIAPEDPEGIMQYEWLNSRGAIARFDRSAIEIRIVDSQESPLADIACVDAIVSALKYLIEETNAYQMHPMETERLKQLYDETIRDGMNTSLAGWADYLAMFHCSPEEIHTARDFWAILFDKTANKLLPEHQAVLDRILAEGNLAERLLASTKSDDSHHGLKLVYAQLCECLNENSLFVP